MKKVLIISFTNLQNDPRVKRQIIYLNRYYSITTVGLNPVKDLSVEFYKIKPLKRSRLKRIIRSIKYKLHRFDELYWGLYDFLPIIEILKRKDFNLIIANDVETLPLVFNIFKNTKVILDTHEYAPRHFADQFTWRFFFQRYNEYLCRKYLKKCNKIITVSDGVANEYRKNYGVKLEVITNAVNYTELKPSDVDERNIKIVTHGLANKNRRLEHMIKVMDYADDRFHFDLMLVPVDNKYYKYLEKISSKRRNVSLIPPVKIQEIISFTNKYDLSFLIFKPFTINFKYGLGNKTFESLQARLGIITGESPEPQANIVNKYGCGLVTKSFEPKEIASELNKLTANDIKEFKNRADIAARELTAERNMKKLGNIVRDLI